MTTQTTTHRQVPSSALQPGALVRFYGATFRLRDDRRVSQHNEMHSQNMERPCFTITGDWVSGEIVPGYFGPEKPWKFQGNDLAGWLVEAA